MELLNSAHLTLLTNVVVKMRAFTFPLLSDNIISAASWPIYIANFSSNLLILCATISGIHQRNAMHLFTAFKGDVHHLNVRLSPSRDTKYTIPLFNITSPNEMLSTNIYALANQKARA